MDDPLAVLGFWPSNANVWLLTAVAAAALIAFFRNSPLARRYLPARDTASAPSRFERFWSRQDGRALALGWVVLVVLTIGDGGLIWSGAWQSVRTLFALVQPSAGVVLVPMTAALYRYKRSVPQVARDDSDERERDVQGVVYRRVHALLVGALVLAAALLGFNPLIGDMIARRLSYAGVAPLDVLIPAFLVLYMLPSVAYAWMLPHRENGTPDDGRPVALAVNGDAG